MFWEGRALKITMFKVDTVFTGVRRILSKRLWRKETGELLPFL